MPSDIANPVVPIGCCNFCNYFRVPRNIHDATSVSTQNGEAF